MKKILVILGLALSLVTNVFADNTIDQLNERVVDLLAPFQNTETSASLAFRAVETNTEHTVKVELNALYKKTGLQNTLDVKVDNLSYNYITGSAPTTILKGSVGLDITKLLSQEQINAIFTQASEMIESLAKEYSQEYGDAASVKGVITSTTKDVDGNFTGITALISGTIDLSKLPDGIDPSGVIATNVMLSVTLNTKTGFTIDGYLVSNPDYFRFKTDEEGLKEILDKLLIGDADAMTSISDVFGFLDEFASSVVNI